MWIIVVKALIVAAIAVIGFIVWKNEIEN